FEIARLVTLRRQELPIDRSELVFEIHDTACEKARYRSFCLGKDSPVDRKSRTLEREHEAIGRFPVPSRKALSRLGAIIGAVDLHRVKLAARILQPLLLRQMLGIKGPAPWPKSPAAYANPDCCFCCFHPLGTPPLTPAIARAQAADGAALAPHCQGRGLK